MNRLQKKAWSELATVAVMIFICIPCFLLLSARNAQGFDYLIICFVTGIPTGFYVYLKQYKKLREYDEREKSLLQHAFYYSTGVFIFYFLFVSFIAFFLIGGKGSIPVVFLPIMLVVGIFVAKCTESFIILMQCAKEADE